MLRFMSMLAAPGKHRRSARALRPGVAALLLLAGCAARAPEPIGAPAPDPGPLAARLTQATALSGPRQIAFGWSLDEAGSKLRGRGVLRVAPPERARLDLFGPRNESYLAAALVGEQFRLPNGAAPAVPLPSPALLWGAVGVIRPPEGAALIGATTADSLVTLRYRAANGEEFRYRVRTSGETGRLEQLERIGGSGVLETVNLDRSAAGDLTRTRYRDWTAFRDLTLDLESNRNVESFPETVWNP